MKKIILVGIMILSWVLRSGQSDGIVGPALGVGSVFSIWLLAQSFPFAKLSYFGEICALFLAISPWHIFITRDEDKSLYILFTILGIYILLKFFKRSSLLYAVFFLLVIIILQNPIKDTLYGFSNTQVPVWLTDEQRREHGNFYNHPLVVLTHNKLTNYTFSFLDHYGQHYQGDFLFISGDVRGKFGEFGQMYPFDSIFIAVALFTIIKNPKGWGIIFIWLMLAPIPSALDFQPPNSIKAANMIVPLILLSSFGASKILRKAGIMKGKLI